MKPETVQLISTIISGTSVLVALSATIFGFWYNRKLLKTNLTHNENSLNQKNREDEKKEIYKKLNEFYGPFLEMRLKSNHLYERFAKIKKKESGKDFRTLIFLLEGNEFIGNDKVLLEEIIKINQKLEEIITEKGGLIDDTKLREDILPRFSAHSLILRLALEKKLQGDIESFQDKTFPREIDDVLKQRINELRERLKKLNSIGIGSYKQIVKS